MTIYDEKGYYLTDKTCMNLLYFIYIAFTGILYTVFAGVVGGIAGSIMILSTILMIQQKSIVLIKLQQVRKHLKHRI